MLHQEQTTCICVDFILLHWWW